MIIEVGQVWKKPTKNLVEVAIDKIDDAVVHVTVNDTTSTIVSLKELRRAFKKNGYFLLTDLAKALL